MLSSETMYRKHHMNVKAGKQQYRAGKSGGITNQRCKPIKIFVKLRRIDARLNYTGGKLRRPVMSGLRPFYGDMFLPVDIIGRGIIGSMVDTAGFLAFAGRNHNKSGND